MTPLKIQILIVEDDPDISDALQMLLQGDGYSSDVAKNGLVALEHIQTHGLPHLILLDMKMPVMSGRQFAHELRARYGARAPALLVMSAAVDTEPRAKEMGAFSWIGKPFRIEELQKKMAQWRTAFPEEPLVNNPA